MKKHALTAVLSLSSLMLWGVEFNIGNLKFESVTASTCELKGFDKGTENSGINLVIPKSVSFEGNTFIVTSIADGALMNTESLETLDIEAEIEYIPEYLCAGCENLNRLSVPQSIKSINAAAFYSCTSLESITVNPNGKELELLTGIEDRAFYMCSSLESTPIMPKLETIGESAFRSCRNLKDFSFPQSLKMIDKYAFTDCEKLSSISISSTLYTLGEFAFDGCSSLKNAAFNIKSGNISDFLFRNCIALENISIQGNILSVGESAFENCQTLSEFNHFDTLTQMGNNAFSGCKSFKKLILRNSLSTIPEGAFSNCTNLEFISVWGKINTIERSAFSDCNSLNVIEICSSVYDIQGNAFANCGNISSVYVDCITPPQLSNSCFDNEVLRAASLYVPAGSEGVYKQTPGWSEFYKVNGVSEFPTHASIEEHEISQAKIIEISGNNLTVLESIRGGVQIYSSDGIKIASLKGYAGESILLPEHSFLIIKCGTTTKKIRVN